MVEPEHNFAQVLGTKFLKRLTILALVCVWMLGLHHVSLGQEKALGLGVIIGEPSGISGKAWVSRTGAIDAVVAWSFREKSKFRLQRFRNPFLRIHLHADYVWHFPLNVLSPQRIKFYTGVGGRLAVDRGYGIFGARIPLGVVWWPNVAPIDVFLELAPIIDLIPATELSANGGIGVRFFFP